MTFFAITLLSHTPIWVWAILATLVTLGLLQSRDHVITRRRLLIQPLSMAVMSLYAAIAAFGPHAGVLAAWAGGALVGAVLLRSLRLPRRVQALPEGRFSIGGSWAPMALMMLIFWLRYVIAASLAMVPALAGLTLFAAVASALYGLAAGLLAARAWRVLRMGAGAAGSPAAVAATSRASVQAAPA